MLLFTLFEALAQPLSEIQFQTEDDITIFGDLYYENDDKPIVMLFHQASSCAQGEYENIIPVLLKNGYNVLAIDQRSGGNKLGGVNRTIEKLEGKTYEYCETYPDFEAALYYVKNDLNFTGKVIAWGSSYSAAMVIHLMAGHMDELAGVLAFSPASGGPMKPCSPNDKFQELGGKALVLRPKREMEVPSVKFQMELANAAGLSTYISNNGIHGASMLNSERVEGSTDETWKVVLDFMANL
ncbi:MAG: hypothetical protein ABJH98_00155 [Reichenbachiella sp.]|uniref:alpha/beta hydrolase family protein n=1 Tax=Reichenbachiella sp. TaxID=2184521 RepID=UPI003299C4C9